MCRYKAYFRWNHYCHKLKSDTSLLPTETDACPSVTAAFLQVGPQSCQGVLCTHQARRPVRCKQQCATALPPVSTQSRDRAVEPVCGSIGTLLQASCLHGLCRLCQTCSIRDALMRMPVVLHCFRYCTHSTLRRGAGQGSSATSCRCAQPSLSAIEASAAAAAAAACRCRSPHSVA
jgi:hypothetical protein